MCARFLLHYSISDLKKNPVFKDIEDDILPEVFLDNFPNFKPVPVLSDKNKIELKSWGLVPRKIKGTPKFKPFNSKRETIFSNWMFRDAIRQRRCVMPISGFVEFTGEKGNKIPNYIHFKSQPVMYAAAIHEIREKNGVGLALRLCNAV